MKRTLPEENRVFNKEWELQFFVVHDSDKVVCLLCDKVISTIKKCNVQRHYDTLHKNNKYAKLEGEARKIAMNKLKDGKQKQKQAFHSVLGIRQENATVEASYQVAYLLGKKGKPFNDSEIIKECIIEVAKCLDPDRVSKYQGVPLSRRTNADRQHELACNVYEQLQAIIQKEKVYYSIALDESTDSTDFAQVLYFIRAITEDFQVFEELFTLGTLMGRTRGIDIFNNFKDKCSEVKLDFANLVGVCTDGAPSMTGKDAGFIAHLKKELPEPNALISFHCILHQQNLCAKSVTLNDTLQKVIGIVNYIRANATRHRQFRDMLRMDNEIISVDLPYHSKVRWLSQGQVLVKILSLRNEIIDFFQRTNKHCALSDPDFHLDVAFLCDLMSKQNELNISLQGKTKSIYEMWQKILSFRKKLLLLKPFLAKSTPSEEHFPY